MKYSQYSKRSQYSAPCKYISQEKFATIHQRGAERFNHLDSLIEGKIIDVLNYKIIKLPSFFLDNLIWNLFCQVADEIR